jgi:hypothetical protein
VPVGVGGFGDLLLQGQDVYSLALGGGDLFAVGDPARRVVGLFLAVVVMPERPGRAAERALLVRVGGVVATERPRVTERRAGGQVVVKAVHAGATGDAAEHGK